MTQNIEPNKIKPLAWVAREGDGDLMLSKRKPTRGNVSWHDFYCPYFSLDRNDLPNLGWVNEPMPVYAASQVKAMFDEIVEYLDELSLIAYAETHCSDCTNTITIIEGIKEYIKEMTSTF